MISLGCPDRTGIVARIGSFLAERGGWIVEADYHADPDSGWFFTRQEVRADSLPFDVDELRERFSEVAAELGDRTEWRVTDTEHRRRVVVLVSREGHCLHDLLGRVASGELDVELCAVISNHSRLEPITEAHGVPFHHVSFPQDEDERAKAAAFGRIDGLLRAHDPHAVVLARFMQVLPPELCAAWEGRTLNIHHSFLPSFAGARPYEQAHARGVKLIGATCHYVTANLDAGPIIEQSVTRVDHRDTVTDMVRKGRDIEKGVLAHGLRAHLEDRVLVHGNRTVVF